MCTDLPRPCFCMPRKQDCAPHLDSYSRECPCLEDSVGNFDTKQKEDQALRGRKCQIRSVYLCSPWSGAGVLLSRLEAARAPALYREAQKHIRAQAPVAFPPRRLQDCSTYFAFSVSACLVQLQSYASHKHTRTHAHKDPPTPVHTSRSCLLEPVGLRRRKMQMQP